MSLLASKLAYHSSMDTGRRQVSQVRDEGQFHTATKARASAFSLQFPEPHFLQSDVRGLDNIFKSMHYVVGEEPPHKEFGSFIMDSKYLCSLSLFFFSWRETIFIMLSSQLYQTYFSCFCYAKSTMSSGKAVITGTCYFKFWDFFTLQPQTHCFPARAAGFIFSG